MSQPLPNDDDLKRAGEIAAGEYPDTDPMHTEAQYPNMRCRKCRDRAALRDTIAEALAAVRAEVRPSGFVEAAGIVRTARVALNPTESTVFTGVGVVLLLTELELKIRERGLA